jgi:hypothetical protein
MGGKQIGEISSRPVKATGGVHGVGTGEVIGDEGPIAASECIDVSHHASRAVDEVEEVA